MSAPALVRWGALTAILGGVLLVISDLWGLLMEGFGGNQSFSETARTSSFAITQGLSLLAAVLILFALVGLYVRQSEEAGVLGVLGFVLAFFGTALVVGVSWALFFVAPSVALESPEFLDAEQVGGPLDTGFMLTSLFLAVGWALFGVAALLAQSYPRWVAIVLIVATGLIGGRKLDSRRPNRGQEGHKWSFSTGSPLLGNRGSKERVALRSLHESKQTSSALREQFCLFRGMALF